MMDTKEPKRRNWTPEQVEIFKYIYPNNKSSDVAKIFNKRLVSVYNLATSLKIKKSTEFLKTEASGRLVGGSRGKAFRFPKGNVPFNKGKKMPPETYEKAKATMFKKGNLPHNAREDGDISIRKDKSGTPYKFIRVALGKWKPFAWHVWEHHNREIPKGMCIWHTDGDSLNDDISNLELITKRENRIRNSGIVNLSDEWVASTIYTKKNPELKEAIRAMPELIELKRNQIKLKRLCRNNSQN